MNILMPFLRQFNCLGRLETKEFPTTQCSQHQLKELEYLFDSIDASPSSSLTVQGGGFGMDYTIALPSLQLCFQPCTL
jgi:hypothetical protein